MSDEDRSPQGNGAADHTTHQGRSTPVPPGMLTKAEAAKILRCSMPTIQRRRGEIPHVMIGRNIYFVEAEIRKWNAAEKVRVKTVKRKDTTYQRRAQSFHGDMRYLEEQLYKIVEEQWPMTVRQTFYQATVRGLVPKTEGGYDQICQRLKDMRDAAYDDESKSVELPMDWIVDNSRRNEERQSFRSTKESLDHAARTYRKDFWHNAEERVLIVVEKGRARFRPTRRRRGPSSLPSRHRQQR
jgi:excisionase family DNA binding protein